MTPHDPEARDGTTDASADAEAEADAAARAHFADVRARVDGFARRRFGLAGTLRLHRAALGLDLLRAPVNVLLAPVHVAISLAALVADRLRLRALSRWLRERRVLLDTDVGRTVEERVAVELLGLEPGSAAGSSAREGDAMARAMLSPPALRRLADRADDPAAGLAIGRRLARALHDYAGTRGAVAEATTALATLVTGAIVFRTLTPGLVSMAPSVAGVLSRDAAISRFWLGETLGGVWYAAFPATVSPWLFGLTLAGLMVLGAVFAAFAGLLADPLQVRLGIHRRRLHRLVDALEAEALGPLSGGFSAPEHYYARLFDLADAGASLLRVFRS